MVNTSLPFTVPVTEKLKAIVLPLWDTEAGVADVKVAEPPLIDKLKSGRFYSTTTTVSIIYLLTKGHRG